MLHAALLLLTAQADLQPVSWMDVTVHDRFWQPRQEINRDITIRHSLAMLEKAGNFEDFRLAAAGSHSGYKGLIFTDSDLYKVLEGISYSLATHPDPALDKRVDQIISMIAAAQMPDGYVNTWHQVNAPNRLFSNLRDEHELYCGGHMIEAAVAHYQATGKRNFLDIALKWANLVDQKFGPKGSGGYPGHPELELALVKLSKATKDERWMALAKQLIENRGHGYFAREHDIPIDKYDGTYFLDDVPIREHTEIKGHAVRAAYLMSGVADVDEEMHDDGLTNMLDTVWDNATQKRIFVTGGIGPSASNEGFTVDYDLPNQTAYQETCASVAMALWGTRMGRLTGQAKYQDAVETALYNGMLSGVGLDGKSFFYVNPLASQGHHHRQEWFECACCPPNVLRTIASIGGLAYSRSDSALYVNLYIGGGLDTQVGKSHAKWDVKTDYPWSGKVEMTCQAPGEYALNLRKPGWCQSSTVTVDSRTLASQPTNGYYTIDRSWQKGDKVTLDMAMPVEQLAANPQVREDVGKTAVRRGPLVYCLEQAGNSASVNQVLLRPGATFKQNFDPGLLGGVVKIQAQVNQMPADDNWENTLYRPLADPKPTEVTLVPYGYWDNRAAGAMEVWIPSAPAVPKVFGPAGRAKVSLSFTSDNCQPWGINDGIEAKLSGEQPDALCHFWPHKGGEEWVQYSWSSPQTIASCSMFWFDDTGRGECRLPQSYRLQAMVDGKWRDLPSESPVVRDQWSTVQFPKVQATALRLTVVQQPGWASGIHEWKVSSK